jgi:hypothetical protein
MPSNPFIFPVNIEFDTNVPVSYAPLRYEGGPRGPRDTNRSVLITVSGEYFVPNGIFK